MLYVQDIEPDTGRWKNLLIHDTRDLREPKLILAKTGELVVDRDRQIVRIELGPGSQHSFFPGDPREYNRTAFASMGWDLPVDEFFPDRKKLILSKGDREMTLGELAARIAQMRSARAGRARSGDASRSSGTRSSRSPPPASSSACSGSALSLGSKKEARSSAFALSIAVIFVYYVLIRLGEQAGDTGMMSPFLSMWAANIVLGAIALALLWLNHREAAFDPLDPAHYLAFVPKVRRQRAARPAPPERSVAPGARRGRSSSSASRGSPCASPRSSTATSPAPGSGNVALVLARLHVHLRPRGVHGPDRRHPAAQRQGQGHPPLLRLPPLADRLHGGAGRGAGGGPGHARPAGPPQRDHRHEGRAGSASTARRGPCSGWASWRASCSTGCRSGCCPSPTRPPPSTAT